MVEGILFDFDGVLADTMEDNYNAWKKAFIQYGINISRNEYFILEGSKVDVVAKTLARNHGSRLSERTYENIAYLKGEIYLKDHNFKFYPEIPELVDYLYRKRKLAIISASTKNKLDNTVPEYFINKFSAVVSGDDCVYGKPDPEPYLIALRKLNLPADKCVVVENAPLGIKSARAAGIYCIGITTTLENNYLEEADIVFENHIELVNFFRSDPRFQ